MFKPLVEFIGTFIFFSVILQHGQAIPIAIALAAVIYFGGSISGGHYNPGVSFMMFLNGQLPMDQFLQYIIVQLLAAAAATYFNRFVAVQIANNTTI